MLKKTKIAAATTMALLGAVAQNASAVALDESGDSAQVLIYPYYNVNNGFQTSFNIRNTKDESKALKIRFRESGISNDVLDFNVYMSPFDHFSMTVSQAENGDAVVSTIDSTCTFPTLPAGGVAFKHNIYDATDQADAREGYLEVIEMGVLPNPTGTFEAGTVGAGQQAVVNGIKHVAGVPTDCGIIPTAWNTGHFTTGGAAAVDGSYGAATPDNIDPPTGGIQGYSILLDVPKGAAFVADAVAIRNYSTTAQHYRSDDPLFFLLPSLASGSDLTSVVINDSGTGAVVNTWAPVAQDWGLSDPGLAPNTPKASGVNPFPMADVLAATGLHNDYFINPDFDGATDWVVTMPMRKHGIYNSYRYDGVATVNASHPVAYFTTLTSGTDVEFTSFFFDREEGEPAPGDDQFSPVADGAVRALDREANILSFTNSDNPTNLVLGSDNPFTFTIENGFVQGWGQLTFSGLDLNTDHNAIDTWVDDAGVVGTAAGVPMIGFAAIRGNFGDSSSANLGETVPHVFNRSRGE